MEKSPPFIYCMNRHEPTLASVQMLVDLAEKGYVSKEKVKKICETFVDRFMEPVH